MLLCCIQYSDTAALHIPLLSMKGMRLWRQPYSQRIGKHSGCKWHAELVLPDIPEVLKDTSRKSNMPPSKFYEIRKEVTNGKKKFLATLDYVEGILVKRQHSVVESNHPEYVTEKWEYWEQDVHVRGFGEEISEKKSTSHMRLLWVMKYVVMKIYMACLWCMMRLIRKYVSERHFFPIFFCQWDIISYWTMRRSSTRIGKRSHNCAEWYLWKDYVFSWP